MFPSLLSQRLAHLCALWLTVLIVCPVAASLSTASWPGGLLTAPQVKSAPTSPCPVLPAPVVAFRAVLPEAGDDTRLAPVPALSVTERERSGGSLAHARPSRFTLAIGNVRTMVLVLRV